MRRKILILSPFFSPNIGGVETHLDDLTRGLAELGYDVYVETFSPITTKVKSWDKKETTPEGVHIRRHKWFGQNIFHFVEKYPILDFLYISPYLMIVLMSFLIKNKDVRTIHAHGMNAALVSVITSFFFRVKIIVSTHAIYEINQKSSVAKFIKLILDRVDVILTLSNVSKEEIMRFGISESKIHVYRYWIDLDRFKPIDDKSKLRNSLNITNKFTILFIGRLIEKKGVTVLLQVAERLKNVNFVFIGNGPLHDNLSNKNDSMENVSFLGKIDNSYLHNYLNCADLLCIPSQYEEGYGRVTMEAVACGVPVVGSNKGSISEAVDDTVSILTDPTVENITQSIELFAKDARQYNKYSSNCRKYAEKKFSKGNIDDITKYY